MRTGPLILIAVLIAGLLIAMYLHASRKEGFANMNKRTSPGEKGTADKYLSTIGSPLTELATIPRPQNASAIPNTLPGSSTANSSEALADFKDLSDLLDIMQTYNTLYENNISTVGANVEFNMLYANAQATMYKVKTQIDTRTVVDTLDFITDQRKKYKAAINAIRSIPSNSNANNSPPLPKTQLSSGHAVTQLDIEHAISRAKDEHKRIDNLRTSAPDLKRRSQILERVSLDLSDIHEKINRGELTTPPFTKAELRNFLSDVGNPAASIRPIPKPSTAEHHLTKTKSHAADHHAAVAVTKPSSQHADIVSAVEQIRSATRDLAWEVRIGYNPKVTIERRLLDRLERLTDQIKSKELDAHELDKKLLELKGLKQQMSAYKRRRVTETNNTLSPYKHKGMPGSHDLTSDDYTIKPISDDKKGGPGYGMTTEQIAHRAGAAGFADTVSGPDYKKRVQELCKQISGADLGDPKEFGCIEKPEEHVGLDYSWRGNYKMVCSRLGHTWGGWYPEMFGCPPSQESTSQAPK